MLPEYERSVVDLSNEEHTHSKELYDVVRLVQEKAADGFQVDDLFALPEIIGGSQAAINWMVQGDAGDPTDDAAIGVRLEATGHALVRAGQFLQKAAAGGGGDAGDGGAG